MAVDSVIWIVALGAIAAGFVQGLVPTLLGAKLYRGIREARFRQIVLRMLTLSGMALWVASVPKVLGLLGEV